MVSLLIHTMSTSKPIQRIHSSFLFCCLYSPVFPDVKLHLLKPKSDELSRMFDMATFSFSSLKLKVSMSFWFKRHGIYFVNLNGDWNVFSKVSHLTKLVISLFTQSYFLFEEKCAEEVEFLWAHCGSCLNMHSEVEPGQCCINTIWVKYSATLLHSHQCGTRWHFCFPGFHKIILFKKKI